MIKTKAPASKKTSFKKETHPKSMTKFIIVITLISGILIVSFFLNTRRMQKSLPLWKVYTNNYYHFRLTIPSDWTTKESLDRYGVPTFILASPNQDFSIQNQDFRSQNPDISYYFSHKRSAASTISIGKYASTRLPSYITQTIWNTLSSMTPDYLEHEIIVDNLPLLNIPRQKDITFSSFIRNNYDRNNALLIKIFKSFSYTREEPRIDSSVSYIIPTGWMKKTDDITRYISFESPDIQFSVTGSGVIMNGALFSINKLIWASKKPLQEQFFPHIGSISATTVDGHDGLFQINCYEGCYEGCYESYYVIAKGYFWSIGLTCNITECSREEGIKTNSYRSAFIQFVNSIRFH